MTRFTSAATVVAASMCLAGTAWAEEPAGADETTDESAGSAEPADDEQQPAESDVVDEPSAERAADEELEHEPVEGELPVDTNEPAAEEAPLADPLAGIGASDPLAGIGESDPLASIGDGSTKVDVDEEGATFGTALDDLGVEVRWSGYGDLLVKYEPGGDFYFDAYHFNPIMGARLSDKTWAEIEMEFEHGGSVLKIEYALLDHTLSDALTIRLGKLLVPIGEFNDILHPSFRWTAADRPAMFGNIQPAVWADVGLEAYGKVDLGSANELKYAVYIVNGLGGDFDLSSGSPVRGLRGNVRDNNVDKGVGGRARFTFAKGATGETMMSLSGYSGVVDADGSNRLSMVNVALVEKLGPVQVIAEASQTFLGDADGALGEQTGALTPYATGAYVYPHVKAGKFLGGVRYDYTYDGFRFETDEDGKVVLDENGDAVRTARVAEHRLVPGIHWAASTFWNLRVQLEVPLDDPAHPTVAGMSAFYF